MAMEEPEGYPPSVFPYYRTIRPDVGLGFGINFFNFFQKGIAKYPVGVYNDKK